MAQLRFVTVIIFVITTGLAAEIPGCDYFDTVDMTDSTLLDDGSYQYGGIRIPANKTGVYQYTISWEGVRINVPKHTRGCICHLMPCLRFCCDPRKSLADKKAECGTELNDYISLLNLTYTNGTTVVVDVQNNFVIQDFGVPCDTHFPLKYDVDNYTLFGNGILYRHYDQINFGKREYCLQPQLYNGVYQIMPHQCTPDQSNLPFIYFQYACVVCMIIVIIIHLLLPENGCHYNKCNALYVSCLALIFLLVNIEYFIPAVETIQLLCCGKAYAGYYLILATFLWLLIINCDVWRQITSSRVKHIGFVRSNLFVWFTAGLFVLIAWVMNMYLPEDYNPKFCVYSCWIGSYSPAEKAYIAGPIAITLILNAVLSILTAMHIYRDGKTINNGLSDTVRLQKSKSEANFKTFLRYFLIAGFIWVLEIVSNCLQKNREDWIDYLTSSQGMLLLIVLIRTKSVRESIRNRLFPKKRNPSRRCERDHLTKA